MADKTALSRDSQVKVLLKDVGGAAYAPATAPLQSSSANTPAIASSATALVANTARKAWAIQNLGTNALFVRLGAGGSTSLFHRVLKGGTVNDDGLGGVLEDETYTGVVSVAGTSMRYCVTEL